MYEKSEIHRTGREAKNDIKIARFQGANKGRYLQNPSITHHVVCTLPGREEGRSWLRIRLGVQKLSNGNGGMAEWQDRPPPPPNTCPSAAVAKFLSIISDVVIVMLMAFYHICTSLNLEFPFQVFNLSTAHL